MQPITNTVTVHKYMLILLLCRNETMTAQKYMSLHCHYVLTYVELIKTTPPPNCLQHFRFLETFPVMCIHTKLSRRGNAWITLQLYRSVATVNSTAVNRCRTTLSLRVNPRIKLSLRRTVWTRLEMYNFLYKTNTAQNCMDKIRNVKFPV